MTKEQWEEREENAPVVSAQKCFRLIKILSMCSVYSWNRFFFQFFLHFSFISVRVNILHKCLRSICGPKIESSRTDFLFFSSIVAMMMALGISIIIDFTHEMGKVEIDEN